MRFNENLLTALLGYPLEYSAGKARNKLYDAILAFLQSTEEKIVRLTTEGLTSAPLGLKIPITTKDIAFIADEIYGGRSAISGTPTKLVLVRWEKPAGSTLMGIGEGDSEQKSSRLRLHELVCMTKEEATNHLREVIQGGKTVDELYPDAIEKVRAKQREIEAWEKHFW